MSVLYHPLKALGLHSSNVPLYIKSDGSNDYFIYSAVGNYFLTYRFSNLALIGTSDRIDENILSITGYKNTIYCGCESKIYSFKRAKHIFQTFQYENCQNWKNILVLGEEGYLCGVSEDNRLVFWNIHTTEVCYTLQYPTEEFTICDMIQPRYKDKIIIASSNGKMQLINFVKRKVIYAFQLDCDVNMITLCPDNDTVAIGCRDGSVILHNILYDKSIRRFKHDLGEISSIAFRTDLNDGQLVMLSGSINGHVTMWDLTKNCNIGQTRDLHNGIISSLFCIPDKPLLITNSNDNSIKIWNYDRPDGTPSLLRSRTGHWEPPTIIKYWPNGVFGSEIISAGGDSALRVFSSYNDPMHNFSMGRAYLPSHSNSREHRSIREQYILPPAHDMAACVAKDGIWDSVVLCHRGHRQITTWSFSKRSRGTHYLDASIFKKMSFAYLKVAAEYCAISICGNFVVVGYSSGHVVKFNLQSGIERGQFGDDCAHEDGMTGVLIGQTDYDNVVITSGYHSIKLWDLATRKLISTITMESETSINMLVLHPSSNMVAVATNKGTVKLVQLATFTVFQELQASTTTINAMTFCNDIDLIVIATGPFVKTFDYINYKLVDCFKVGKPVTQLQMAPNDSFLITSHMDDLGLYVWSLKLHYLDMKLSSLSLDYLPIDVIMTAQMLCDDDNNDNDDDNESYIIDTINGQLDINKSQSNNNQADSMLQLSGLAPSYFANLVNIDNLRIRNENAAVGMCNLSFFVPQIEETLDGLKWRDNDDNMIGSGVDDVIISNNNDIDQSQSIQQQIIQSQSREKKRKIAEIKDNTIDNNGLANLTSILSKCRTDDDFDQCMTIIKSMSPTIINHEIQMLNPNYNDNGYGAMIHFLSLINNQLQRLRNVELSHTYLACLLQHNTDCLTTINDNSIITTGISGLIQSDIDLDNTTTNHINDDDNNNNNYHNDRLQALTIINTIIDNFSTTTSIVKRQLASIIEMARFSHNNL